MLELRNVSKIYKDNKKSPLVKALSNINLTFGSTGLVFVLGKSGCGKSTLLNIVGGLETPSSGEVVFDNKSLKNFRDGDFNQFRSTFVGFIFQEFNLINDLTVKQNIDLALELQGQKTDDSLVSSLLSDVGLEGYENRMPSTLSGGEKQRIAIVRCLIKNPKIILADEPTGSLDSENAEIVLNVLKKISKEKMVIVVSHDTESANAYGDRIITLKDGKVYDDTGSCKDIDCNNINSDDCDSSKKSKLPFPKCLKLGLNNVKHKVGKFILSTILMGFSLSFLGVCSTVLFFDEPRCASDAALKNHLDAEMFSKNIINDVEIVDYDYLNDKILDSVKDVAYIKSKISTEEIENLNSNTKYNLNYTGVYSNGDYDFEIAVGDEFCNPFTTKEYSCSLFSGFCDCGDEYLSNNSMPILCGKYPSVYNEVAISKYHAQLIANYYLNKGNNADFENIIGKKIKIALNDYNCFENSDIFTISGIYDTGDISDFYKNEFKNKRIVSETLFESYLNYLKSSFNCVCFVSDDFYSHFKDAFDYENELKITTKVYFSGINVDYKKPIEKGVFESDSTDFLFSRFNDLNNFSFYDLNGNDIEYKEPVGNQIYLDKKAYDNLQFFDFYYKIYNSFDLIKRAYNELLLPEFDSWLENNENLVKYENAVTFFELVGYDTLQERFDEYKNAIKDISGIINCFYEKSFERLYVYDLINTLDSWNDIGNFGRSEFENNSAFFANYIVPIRSGEFDDNVFDDCIDYILNNSSLKTYAENILRYDMYFPGESIECDNYYNALNILISGGNGKSIDSAKWNNFNKVFLRQINDGNFDIVDQKMYSKDNITCICNKCEMPTFNFEVNYPSNIFYKNSLQNKGVFEVIGLFEDEEIIENYYVIFANEEFINSIAIAPDKIWYYKNNLKANITNDGIYDFVLTKSTFTKQELKEIMNDSKGYQYRFSNKDINVTNTLFIILDQFYAITILGTIIFGIFAALLLINFISSSISYRKKEIGIIRCLGGRSADIFKVFATESVLISIISIIISSVLSIIACSVFNSVLCNYYTFSILHFGILNFAFIFVVCVLFGLLATFIPILKTSKMSPASIVRHE